MAALVQSTTPSELARERYISLTTFRKTGEAVVTTIWFAQAGTVLYAYSDATAGKVKRVRNTPQVRFAACTLRGAVTGPTHEGRARLVTNPREIAAAEAAIARKYGLTRRLLGLFNRLNGFVRPHRPKTGTAYLAIVASDEMEGES